MKKSKPAQPKARGRKGRERRSNKCTPGVLNDGEFDSGWKKGESAEIRNLGTKNQPRRTAEVDALLKWMPELLDRCRAAESWPDPDRHPHVPAALLRTLAPMLQAVAGALDGKPARLERLSDQIIATGTRRARTIPGLDLVIRPLLEDPTIEWLPGKRTTATLAALHARVAQHITKPGLRAKLQRFKIRYGVTP